MNTQYSVKSYVLENGERYCLLFDSNSEIPLFYPNLFITTQVRNRSLSYSTMEGYLNGLLVLYKFMDESLDCIERRFKSNNFLETHEIEALRDFCKISFKKRTTKIPAKSIFNLKEYQEFDKKASSQTQYTRLTGISVYVDWLAKHLAQLSSSSEVNFQVDRMTHLIKEMRPPKKPVSYEDFEKNIDDKQTELLFELFRPESEFNPFEDNGVRVRNRLIFLMLYFLGIRRGELLNIKIDDIDFSNYTVSIKRNADDKLDKRLHQPKVKTRDRLLPMRDTLAAEIYKYVSQIRKFIPNAKKTPFLLISHKPGPDIGKPLSISSYKKVMNIVREVSPILHNLVGHNFRKDWNYRFSIQMDNMDKPPSEQEQEKMRSYLMGWLEGSGTAAIYNKRFTKEKAHTAALHLQSSIVRLPNSLKGN